MATVFHARPSGRFTEIQNNLRGERNFIERIQVPIFQQAVLAMEIINSLNPIQKRKSTPASQMICLQERQPQHPLPAPVDRVLYIRFKFRNQLQLLPQIRCLITLKLKSSIINIDSNITDKIIRKVINVQWENCRTKNGGLRTPALAG